MHVAVVFDFVRVLHIFMSISGTLTSLMETIKQKGARRTDDSGKTTKTRQKRRRHKKHRCDKGSADSMEKAPEGATIARHSSSKRLFV